MSQLWKELHGADLNNAAFIASNAISWGDDEAE